MKPDEIRHKIVEMFPMHDKIELFARSRFDGWDEWGLDVLDNLADEFNLTGN